MDDREYDLITSDIKKGSVYNWVLMRCAWSSLLVSVDIEFLDTRPDFGAIEEFVKRRVLGVASFMRNWNDYGRQMEGKFE